MKRIDWDKARPWILLFIYAFLIYGFTVLFRSSTGEVRCELVPFWSYAKYFRQLMSGEVYYNYPLENFGNVVMFMPLGFAHAMAYDENGQRLSLSRAALCGMLFSILIETSQFIGCRGLVEVDDVIHNTLGSVLGVLSYECLMWMQRRKNDIFWGSPSL